MTALVTCIVPVYNGERFIGEAIASILAQTHRDTEVIVVDDGSTDGTAAVVSAQCPTATYLRQGNAGPAAARNLGIAHARGDFIALLDSDDRWMPMKLERQLATLEESPRADCVLTRAQMFWESGLDAEESVYRLDNRTEVAGYAGSTMLARRSVFERVGDFRADLPHAATVEWFERATSAGVVMETLQETLVERRMHKDNFSRRQRASSHDEFLRLVKQSIDRRRSVTDV